ncbi:MAG: HypC/HybG/HupF family hydrogenase formation chaperone [Propionibacteriales bacterium]|nr:HypC/HybG/HupF family hydrogenase formation chaperone [Propionibacteriales bacterium]
MCLGIPGQVVEMVDGYGGQLALVDVVGARSRVNIGMLDLDEQDLSSGDWILIHMGFAVERVDAAGAERAMAGLEMMGRPRDAGSDSEDTDDLDVPPSAQKASEPVLNGSGASPVCEPILEAVAGRDRS